MGKNLSNLRKASYCGLYKICINRQVFDYKSLLGYDDGGGAPILSVNLPAAAPEDAPRRP
jgi:hypothetical protein